MTSASDTQPTEMDVKTSGRIFVLFSIISVMLVSHHVAMIVASLARAHCRGQNSERIARVFRGTIKSLLSHLARLQLWGFAELAVLGCTSFGGACWTLLGKIWIFWGDQELEQETLGVVLNASFTARMVREVFVAMDTPLVKDTSSGQDGEWWAQTERGI